MKRVLDWNCLNSSFGFFVRDGECFFVFVCFVFVFVFGCLVEVG